MNNYQELIESVKNGETIDIEELTQLLENERLLVEEQITLKIKEGDAKFYKYIPTLKDFHVEEFLTYEHSQKLKKNNWLELEKNIYLRCQSTDLLDSLLTSAKYSLYALNCVIEISEKNPDIVEFPYLSYIIDGLKKRHNRSKNR